MSELQVGHEEDGFRYIGGDPGQESSWEPVQAASGQQNPFRAAMDMVPAMYPAAAAAKAGAQVDPIQMAKNFPGSVMQVGKDLWEGVTNPGLVAQAAGDLVTGTLQHAGDVLPQGNTQQIEPEVMDSINRFEDRRAVATGLLNYLNDRYGSVDGFARTLEEDPAGALIDFMSVMGPKNAAKVNPRTLAGKAIANTPDTLYQGAAKFGTTIPRAERRAMTRTALANRVGLSERGANLLQRKIERFAAQVDDLIATSTARGEPIHASKMLRHIDELKRGNRPPMVGSSDRIGKIDEIVDGWKADLGRRTKLTPDEVQAMKQDLYNQVNYNVTNQTGLRVEQDTLKNIARAAKESLEEIIPEVKGANDTLGDLLELQGPLERAVARIGNRNMIGRASTGLGATLGAITGNQLGSPIIGTAIGTGLGALAHPRLAAQNAIMLNSLVTSPAAKALVKANPYITMAELAAALGGRAIESQSASQLQGQ